MTKRKDIERKKKDLEEYEKALVIRALTELRRNTAKSAQGYDEVAQKLSDLGVTIEVSSAKAAQAVSSHFELSAHTSRFLESPKFPEINSRHEQITLTHKKTFEWIFDGLEDLNGNQSRKWTNFVGWLKSRETLESLYWIQGKAGSGKSTLMSYLVHHQRTQTALHRWCDQDSTLLMPCFFFWNVGSSLQKSVQGLLRSITYQLLRGSNAILVEIIADDDCSHSQLCSMEYEVAWTEQRLFDLLDRIIEISKRLGIYVCFFLDGLDEYVGEKDRLINFIIRVSKQKNLKICVSSRPEEAYRQAFVHKAQLCMQDLTQADIARYISDRLGSHLSTSSGPHDCNGYMCQWGPLKDDCPKDLMRAVGQRACGVFLWVKLVVSDLFNGITAGESIRQLRQSLEETPIEIKDLFTHMLERLPKRFLTSGVRYLSMILAAIESDDSIHYAHADERINVLDVAFAEEHIWNNLPKCDWSFAIDPGFDGVCDRLKSRILYCCAGLVEVQDSYEIVSRRQQSSKLNFIHRSVIDFLRSDSASPLSPATIKEAHILYVRAKISLCAFYFSECAKDFYIGPHALTEEDSGDWQRFLDNPSTENFSSPTVPMFPCMQEAWVFLLWRAAFGIRGKGSDIIIQRITNYLQYLLNWEASLDSACLIVLKELDQSLGYFILKISAFAIIQRLLNWPGTEGLSDLMATYNGEPYERYEYYVNNELTLYRLNDTIKSHS